MGTKTIDIDLDVYKTIEGSRISFDETPNEILRRLLKLPVSTPLAPKPVSAGKGRPFVAYGAELADGTKLQGTNYGTKYEAQIRDGKIEYAGRRFATPSGAAKKAVGHNRNGWEFWCYQDDKSGKWLPMAKLKRPTT